MADFEVIQVKRTSKFGIQLMDSTYRYTTEQVKEALLNLQLPAKIEVLEADSKKKITKINYLEPIAVPKPNFPTKNPFKQAYNYGRDSESVNGKALTMLVSYAKDQVVALIQHAAQHKVLDIEVDKYWEMANTQVLNSFNFFKKKLEAGDLPQETKK